ncbi:MAG: proton-conducting transporter membrane subunit [Acidobacteria bacterium]|nr:proton-conducting transporter membrane subunit [Acidobacteriota bacterium]
MTNWLLLDSFNAVPLMLYAVLWLAMLMLAPKQDLTGNRITRWLMVLAGTALVYTANHLALYAVGWILSAWPLVEDPRLGRLTRTSMALGGMALAGGLALIIQHGIAAGAADPWLLSSLSGAAWSGGQLPFALLTLAVIQRKGIFPLHSWVPQAMERGDLLVTGLVLNGHFGAVTVARVALPLLGDASRASLSILADLGLFTAVLGAIVAVADRKPRRLLAWVAISQASTILAGLESLNRQAITGAMLHWMVVSIATSALFGVLRLVEVRHGLPISGTEYLGLGRRFPRLAVFFVVAGVALVGLPGTLGFVSEDLLMHGALETHPWIGLAVPLATALNAIGIFRLFGILFLGRRLAPTMIVPDAITRERWPLAALILLLVALGLVPQMAINLRSAAAVQLERIENPAALPGDAHAPAAQPHP